MNHILVLILLVISGCSFKKNPLKNQKKEGHNQLYSEPDQIQNEGVDQNYFKVIIAATSGISHKTNATIFSFTDLYSESNQQISVGGFDTIKSYQQILRSKYEHVLMLDSGDSVLDKNSMTNQLDYDAQTFGLGDFNRKLSSKNSTTEEDLKNFAKNSKTPFVVSNLLDLRKGKRIQWPGVQPHLIKEINGIKFGIIGIIPEEISTLTPVSNRVGLIVQDMVQSTLSEARILKNLGAEVIIVLTNQSLKCGIKQAEEQNLPVRKINFDPKIPDTCELNSPLGQFIKRLPPNLVDVVITGRNQEKVANIINTTIVIGGFNSPDSMIYTELFFEKESKSLIKEKSIIHQPVVFCREFFKETQDCFFEDQSINHKDRTPAIFLGEPIKLNPTTVFDHHLTSKNIDYYYLIEELKVDLILKPVSMNNAELRIYKIKGKDLLNLLEEDFNNGDKSRWFPVKFETKEEMLSVFIEDKTINHESYYLLATDHQTLSLRTKISNQFLEIATGNEWHNFIFNDQINIKASSNIRQRQ